MNKELAKTLTTALVQFIDNERPEGTLDCSSGECVSLEKAFTEENFDSVETLVNKKLTGLATEFEQELAWIICEWGNSEETKISNFVKKYAPKLLALAKKELARRDEVITLNNMAPYDKGLQDGKAEAMTNLERTVIEGDVDNIPKWLVEELNKAFKKGQESSHEDYIRGYTNGYKDAQEEYNKSVAYHFPVMPTPPSGWGCDGTHCTNPHHDCINCPVKYSSGGTITTPNTASGISTATLHGNTSATDGKEHNPSFTD